MVEGNIFIWWVVIIHPYNWKMLKMDWRVNWHHQWWMLQRRHQGVPWSQGTTLTPSIGPWRSSHAHHKVVLECQKHAHLALGNAGSRLWSKDSKATSKNVTCQARNFLSFERLDISLFVCQSTGQRSKCPCELCPPKSGIPRDRHGECRYSLAKFLNASSTIFHHLSHEWTCLTASNFRDAAQPPIRFSVSSCSSSRLPMTTGCEAMKLASISASQGNLAKR